MTWTKPRPTTRWSVAQSQNTHVERQHAARLRWTCCSLRPGTLEVGELNRCRPGWREQYSNATARRAMVAWRQLPMKWLALSAACAAACLQMTNGEIFSAAPGKRRPGPVEITVPQPIEPAAAKPSAQCLMVSIDAGVRPLRWDAGRRAENDALTWRYVSSAATLYGVPAAAGKSRSGTSPLRESQDCATLVRGNIPAVAAISRCCGRDLDVRARALGRRAEAATQRRLPRMKLRPRAFQASSKAG